jgi:hypothetical protein
VRECACRYPPRALMLPFHHRRGSLNIGCRGLRDPLHEAVDFGPSARKAGLYHPIGATRRSSLFERHYQTAIVYQVLHERQAAERHALASQCSTHNLIEIVVPQSAGGFESARTARIQPAAPRQPRRRILWVVQM